MPLSQLKVIYEEIQNLVPYARKARTRRLYETGLGGCSDAQNACLSERERAKAKTKTNHEYGVRASRQFQLVNCNLHNARPFLSGVRASRSGQLTSAVVCGIDSTFPNLKCSTFFVEVKGNKSSLSRLSVSGRMQYTMPRSRSPSWKPVN
jgi:hypothetical protein